MSCFYFLCVKLALYFDLKRQSLEFLLFDLCANLVFDFDFRWLDLNVLHLVFCV